MPSVSLPSRRRQPGATTPQSEPRILFVHIPKTAGMSLYDALQRWATPVRSLRYPNGGGDYPAYRALPPARIDELRLLSGHLTYPAFRFHELSGWSPITLLREPVERTLSVFSFLRSNRDHPWHEMATAMSLAAFIEWLEDHPANIDQQCQFIAGERDAGKALEILEQEFALAATVEHMGPFVDRLAAYLGSPLRVGRRNRSLAAMRPRSVDPVTLARIRAMNEQDARLHARVLEAGLVGRLAPDA